MRRLDGCGRRVCSATPRASSPRARERGPLGCKKQLPGTAHKTAISCWLVPPEKPQAELSALVQRLANENGLPAFDVHITIIGDVLGEHCSSVAEAIERLQLLAHAGAVPCRFASIECFPPWNQSLMAVAEESPERQHGQTRHPGSGRADHPRPEAPSRVRTAAIWAPEQSYCLGPRSAIPGASPRRRDRVPSLFEAPLQMPTRAAAFCHSGALPAAAARAADLLRHPRGGGQGRVGHACGQAALLSGKPPDDYNPKHTLSTP